MRKHRPSTSRSTSARWAAVAILLIAAALRLAAFQEALVGADQSSILAAAAEVAAFRDLPLVGIKSSVGVMQTAVVAYIAALPLLILHRVIAIRWFFNVLDLLALAFLYRATRRAFGPRAAWIAALLYAANPWLVEFNRWIWYQTLIPTFATVAFAALLLALARPVRPDVGAASNARPSHLTPLLALAVVAAALMGLVHLASLPWAALLGFISLGVAWAHRRRRGWWHGIALGAGVSLLIAAPYLVYLGHTGFADVGTILRGGAGSGGGWNTAALRLGYELLSGSQVLQTPRDPRWGDAVRWIPALLPVVPLLLGLATLDALLRLVLPRPATGSRRRNRATLAFALGWTVLAPALFLRSSIHLQHFYLLFLFPAPFVLIGAAAQHWTRTQPRTGAVRAAGAVASATAVVASIAVLVVSGWWAYLWVVRIGFEQQGHMRAPTRAWLMDATVDRVNDVLSRDPETQVIILTEFAGGELSPFDWVRNFVHSDRVRVVPGGEGFIVPATPTCYFLAQGATAQMLAPIADRAVARPELTVPASPPWTFTCTPARPPLSTPLAAWQNGMDLLAATVTGTPDPGTALGLSYTWHYRPVAAEEYHIFSHLVCGGELAGQIDGAGVPTRYWRDDDVLVTNFVLMPSEERPAGGCEVRTGTYTWPGLQRVLLDDGSDAYVVRSWDR